MKNTLKQDYSLDKSNPKPVAIVTGASSGIGFETAKGLVQEGYHVIMACKQDKQAEKAFNSLLETDYQGSVQLVYIDLASLSSVNAFCNQIKNQYESVSLLVNNAGINDAPFNVTEDGFESTFQVNYLAHVLLTH